MRVRIIRHGETAGNAQKKYIGSTDQPLSEHGLEKARLIPPDPSVKKVFVSPLIRARETAAILFPEAEQRIVNDLREMDFGAFENRSYLEMEHDEAYRAWVDSDCTLPCPGGEGMSGFAERVCEAFLTLFRENAEAEEIVIVAHGGTIMAVLSLFAAEPRPYYEWNVANLEGWRAEVAEKNGVPLLKNIEKISNMQ